MPSYGYAHVVTFEQDLGIQRIALKEAGCKAVRAEEASGTRRDGRSEPRALLDFVQSGDILAVTRVSLRATKQPVDTAAGKLFLDMLGMSAEFQINLRRERQLEGIKAAAERGIHTGRRPGIDAAEVRRLREQERPGPAAIAKRLGTGRANVHRVLGRQPPPAWPPSAATQPALLCCS